MTATLAPTGRPINPILTWADQHWIYIEIPSRTGQPLIQKFSRDAIGLHKLVNLYWPMAYEWTGEPINVRKVQSPLEAALARAVDNHDRATGKRRR